MSDGTQAKFVLHIGDPKTGTTSIQKALRLRAVHSPLGAIEAHISPKGSANALGLARAFRDPDAAVGAEAARQLRDWLSGLEAPIGIVSSELFDRVDPARLSQFFDSEMSNVAKQMRVIAYVRPHASRMLAAFVQRIKMFGGATSLNKHVQRMDKSKYLHYSPRFSSWADSFGDRFVLRPFVREELVGGDAVQDFFTQVYEGGAFEISGDMNENTALTERTLAGLVVVHRKLVAAGVPDQRRTFIAQSLFKNLPRPQVGSRSKPYMSREAVEFLQKHYAEDAREVDARFFGRNILAQELDKAMASAQPQEPDLSPTAHFDPAELKELKELAQALTKRKRKAKSAELADLDDGGAADDEDDLTSSRPARKPLSQEAVEIARILAG